MRIVFMGTPDFAAPCLKRLYDDGHTIAGVFCQPDRPTGRHQTLTPPPVKRLAAELGLPVYQPAGLRGEEPLRLLKQLAPELIAVVAYGRILPPALLALPRYGCVNIHGSLLPKYRGAAPIQWSVINGEKYGGVTAMHMAEGLDTGDIIFKRGTLIGPEETAGELFDRLCPMAAQMLSDTVRLFACGGDLRLPQDEAEATLAPMLDKATGAIDWTRSARELHDLVRGLNPWPSAHTVWAGRRIKVHRAAVVEQKHQTGRRADCERFIVGCGKNSLELLEVQPEGKGRMSGADFLRGLR